MIGMLVGVGLLVALATHLLFSLEAAAVRPEQRLQDLVRRGAQPLVSRSLPGTPDDPAAPAAQRRKGSQLTRAVSAVMQEALQGRNFAKRMDDRLRRSGVKLQVGEFVTIQMTLAVGLVAVGMLLLGPDVLVLCVGLAAGRWLPEMWLSRQRKTRLRLMDGQLADAMSLLANSLRSGYSFLQAMEVISREMPEPICKEFGQVLRETRVNIPLEEALQNLQQRVDSNDLALVITAVLIQRQVGGNLAEVLDKISETIRDRIKLLGEVRTLTSMGRMSGWIVSLLPIVLGLAIYALNPDYLRPMLTSPLGWVMLAIAGGMQGTGILVIQSMVKMEV